MPNFYTEDGDILVFQITFTAFKCPSCGTAFVLSDQVVSNVQTAILQISAMLEDAPTEDNDEDGDDDGPMLA